MELEWGLAVRNRDTGFTLAEVLIALALLGVVAAFAIPKILINTQSSQKASTFKEAIATVDQLFRQPYMSGTFDGTKLF